jgi:hypothetical protein
MPCCWVWNTWEPQLQLFFSADHQAFADLHDVVADHERLLKIIEGGDMESIIFEIDRHAQRSTQEHAACRPLDHCVTDDSISDLPGDAWRTLALARLLDGLDTQPSPDIHVKYLVSTICKGQLTHRGR